MLRPKPHIITPSLIISVDFSRPSRNFELLPQGFELRPRSMIPTSKLFQMDHIKYTSSIINVTFETYNKLFLQKYQ